MSGIKSDRLFQCKSLLRVELEILLRYKILFLLCIRKAFKK